MREQRRDSSRSRESLECAARDQHAHLVREAKQERRERREQRATRHQHPRGHGVGEQTKWHGPHQFGAERDGRQHADECRPDVEAATGQVGYVDAHEHAAGTTCHPQHAVADDHE